MRGGACLVKNQSQIQVRARLRRLQGPGWRNEGRGSVQPMAQIQILPLQTDFAVVPLRERQDAGIQGHGIAIESPLRVGLHKHLQIAGQRADEGQANFEVINVVRLMQERVVIAQLGIV